MDDSHTMIARFTSLVCYMNVVSVCFLGATYVRGPTKEVHGTEFSNKDSSNPFIHNTPMPLRVGYGDVFLNEKLRF